MSKDDVIVDAEFVTKDNLPAPVDVQSGAMMLSPEQQRASLAQYEERRNHFIEWLLSHFIEGVHYGFPPGCEVKLNERGQVVDRKNIVIDQKQWRPKPCLYKSGAMMVTDLLQLKAQFAPDTALWEMLGKKSGVIAMRCDLHTVNRDTKQRVFIGSGYGVFLVNEKHMNENAAVKMAEKRSQVDAVLNCIPVMGELFTQDAKTPAQMKEDKETASALNQLWQRYKLSASKAGYDETVAKAGIVALSHTVLKHSPPQSIDECNKLQDAVDSGDYDLATGETIGG